MPTAAATCSYDSSGECTNTRNTRWQCSDNWVNAFHSAAFQASRTTSTSAASVTRLSDRGSSTGISRRRAASARSECRRAVVDNQADSRAGL